MRIVPFAFASVALAVAPGPRPGEATGAGPPPSLAAHVEVRRTAHGVPHIKADNLEAAAYALAYVQLEDYGARVAMGLVRARGELARWFGHDSIETDF